MITLPAFTMIKARPVPVVSGNDGMKTEISVCEGEANIKKCNTLTTS